MALTTTMRDSDAETLAGQDWVRRFAAGRLAGRRFDPLSG